MNTKTRTRRARLKESPGSRDLLSWEKYDSSPYISWERGEEKVCQQKAWKHGAMSKNRANNNKKGEGPIG